MAPALRVPLRHDQHVLAESGEVLATERAPVRGGLAILSSAQMPPLRRLQLGHLSKDVISYLQHAMVARVDHRDERIVVETGRYRLTGVLRLPKDGYRSRLTDYLNASERNFLPLTDVEIMLLDGDHERERRAFVALSLSQIVLAMPADAHQVEE